MLKTPVRAPRQTRYRRAVRQNHPRLRLGELLIVNRRHLERAPRIFIEHHNTQRPHRALELQPPQPAEQLPTATIGEVQRRDRLGGLIIHEYVTETPPEM